MPIIQCIGVIVSSFLNVGENIRTKPKRSVSTSARGMPTPQKKQCTEHLDKPFLKGGNGCPLGEQSDTDPQKERAAKLSHQQDHCFHRRVHRIFPFLFRGIRPAGAIDNGSEQSHLISTVISSRSSSTPASYQQRRGDCGDRPYRYRHPSAVFDFSSAALRGQM